MNMMSPKKNRDVALIVGPTASGKSALALALAKKQPSVVINADSAQVYRDLAILSARPTEPEMAGIQHELYGYIDGAETCSAARWASDAKTSINAAQDNNLLPILVGGTGLYVRTLLDGIAPIPTIDPAIRDNVRRMATEEAYLALSQDDPASAERLQPTDTTRVQRALEVVRSTGEPLAHWHRQRSGGIADQIALRPLILLPPRDWLYERCDRRFEIMIEQGARQEVEALLERKLALDCPVMRAIGVPEISAWINGEIDAETAIKRAQTATRQYAKRQYTWFRNQCPQEWPRFSESINENFDNQIEILLRQ